MKAILIVIISLLGLGQLSNTNDLLTYKDSKGKIKPVKKIDEWQLKRHQILDSMQAAMGPLPSRKNLPDLKVTYRDSLITDKYVRYSVVFFAEANEDVTCYLYVPLRVAPTKKLPAMLVLHGTGALGKRLVDGESPNNNRAQAKELAERGYVVIAPDYPSMGEQEDYDFEKDRYVSGTMKAIFNHMRCVDLLETMDNVDANRIGVLGHSLGGHNSMFVGAFDKRLKVIVSSCGWTPMDYYDIEKVKNPKSLTRLKPWAQERYMPLLSTNYTLNGEDFPFDFDEVIAALAPRPFFSNSPINDSNFDYKGVEVGISSASKVYSFLNASNNLQVRYPKAEHDFPTEVRKEAYAFIDKVLLHTPRQSIIE